MAYFPPESPKPSPSTCRTVSTRVTGPSERDATTSRTFGFWATSADREHFVDEVVHFLELAVETREPLHMPPQLELHLLREHDERAEISELRVGGLRPRDPLPELHEGRPVEREQ